MKSFFIHYLFYLVLDSKCHDILVNGRPTVNVMFHFSFLPFHLCCYLQLQSGGVKSCQHATTEGHSEDSHPDAWGLPPAYTTGPGNVPPHTHTVIQYSSIVPVVCLFSDLDQAGLL